MRNKTLFKSTLCIPLLMLVCTLLPQRAVGQPAVNYALNYNSLDIATPNQFISSGGSYWNIKDATTINANSGCYKIEVVSVKLIDCIITKTNKCTLNTHSDYDLVPVSLAPQPMTFDQICITP